MGPGRQTCYRALLCDNISPPRLASSTVWSFLLGYAAGQELVKKIESYGVSDGKLSICHTMDER